MATIKLVVDGKPVYGCMQLAVDMVGKKITTVEGLAKGDTLSPIQAAFVEKDALMCGFCTPGFLMSLTALLEKNPNPTPQPGPHQSPTPRAVLTTTSAPDSTSPC